MLFPSKKIFLLDAMSLIYRAHYAFGNTPPSNAQGIKTGTILGFVNTLVEVLQKETPTHVIVAFDAKEKTFRHELFPAYKSHRQAQPEEISIAIPYIRNILDGFGISCIEIPGYEADDLLGTLAKKTAKMGFKAYIMSSDKDLCQVIEDHIYIYKPASNGQKSSILGEKEILEQWEITRPEQVRDILALEGDASDFIPGIPSIGKKTARKLIKEFDNLENLLAHADQLTGKLKENIIRYADQGVLSKQLATICTEVSIDLDMEQYMYHGPDKTKLEPIFDVLEFKALKKRLFGITDIKEINKTPSLFDSLKEKEKDAQPHTTFRDIHTTPHTYTLIQRLVDCQNLVEKLQKEATWAFDTETTGLDPHMAKLLGISFSCKAGEAYYLSIPTHPEEAQSFLLLLQPLLSNGNILKVGQNLKYDLIVLQRHGLSVAPPLFDTMIAHALIAPDMRHNLTVLSKQYLNYTPIPIEELIGPKGKKQLNMEIVPLEQVTAYAAEDADLTLQIYEKISLELQAEALVNLFYKVEMPLVPVLVAMEIEGVTIDVSFLSTLSENIQSEAELLKKKIFALAETVFNINSPKQLGEVLFEKMKISTKPIKTKSGQYATGEEILEKLIKAHPIVETIMEYRELQKLLSTYVEALPKMVHSRDKRVHTSYQQTIVTTGRLSSTDPNLQNIPIRTERGRALRKAFIPHNKGDFLLSADYSQIELRVMAAYAQDATMIEAFRDDKDIHQITASKLFKIPLEAVDAEMRRKAKIANFGIIYGISAFGLSQRMGNLSRTEAAQLIDSYFQEFPGIKRYMDKTIADAREKGYITTLMGRKRFLPDIHSRNAAVRGFAERNAINTPIQGSAAEMIKLAMIPIQNWLETNRFKSRLIMQVHDELVFNVPREELAHIEEHVPLFMTRALPLENVPIKVNCGVGLNWLEAH
ncbi:DNA polymerase I [Cardinium endosymbiont of Culicoides punctatus]|uniref:DNA polymerase I n=1 Tax=Cardinium endosymbiont of Culicoides punctatus TaxID=2304601 RepID=UPI00105872BE|nr:DNA polymerase I [Cardinium endosymbiont of Culicoides punctatus]TDG95121.1 DNA polymerase I [Cardinium endosymbiont of Culicoides punctatus]